MYKMEIVRVMLVIFSLFPSQIPLTETARILGIFPVPSVSHQIVYRQLMLALNQRGHEVVIVTTNPIPDAPPNYTQIDIGPGSYKLFHSRFDFGKMVGSDRVHPAMHVIEMMDFFCDLNKIQIEQTSGLMNDTANYDLLFLEWFVSPSFLGFSHHFNIPVIGVSSLPFFVTGYNSVGSPTHSSYLPDSFVGSYPPLSFWERLNSAYYETIFQLKYYYSHLSCQDEISKKFFGSNTPYVGDIEKNVSMLMSNTHFTTSIIRPLVPAVVEFGGPPLHLTPAKPLPKDLQEFLDGATDGAVYFSLGSNVKSSSLPENKRTLFLSAFRQIRQKILWKWEMDDLPGKPDNVKLQKWLPQTDVLAHPNVKAFITQGGLQSMGEATHFEKPMIVIPFFADQEANAKKLESEGVAIRMDFDTMTEKDILEAVNEVVTNPKYLENMKKYSELTKDQPEAPIKRFIWWTEYVIRHNGAKHLRSPAIDMPWYQYLLLDVLGFLVMLIGLIILIFRIVSKILKPKDKLD